MQNAILKIIINSGSNTKNPVKPNALENEQCCLTNRVATICTPFPKETKSTLCASVLRRIIVIMLISFDRLSTFCACFVVMNREHLFCVKYCMSVVRPTFFFTFCIDARSKRSARTPKNCIIQITGPFNLLVLRFIFISSMSRAGEKSVECKRWKDTANYSSKRKIFIMLSGCVHTNNDLNEKCM